MVRAILQAVPIRDGVRAIFFASAQIAACCKRVATASEPSHTPADNTNRAA